MALFVATSPIVQADHEEAQKIRRPCGIDPVGGGEEVDSDGEPEFKTAGSDAWIPEGVVDVPEGRGTPTIAWFGIGLALLAALGLLRSTRKQL